MKRVALVFALAGVLFSLTAAAAAQQEEESSPARASNLNVIRFSGTLRDSAGKSGVAGVTFTLYGDEAGTQVLWSEVQNVRVDRQGRYTVLLGAETAGGLPMEVFSADSARWLGARYADGRETRTLLVSVPYALKAAFATTAETLGGMPASSFVTRNELSTVPGGSGMMVLATGGTVPLAADGTTGKIAKFTSTDATNANIGDSFITELGGADPDCNDASPCIGIGTTAPLRTLHVKGASGALLFDAGNLATNPVLFFAHDNFASPFRNRLMLSRIDESMQIWSQNVARLVVKGSTVGINTENPQDELHVVGTIRTTAGIRFNDGTLQTTAGGGAGGDITQVTAGAGLSGGGTTGGVTLQVQSCATGQILKSTGTNAWGCAADGDGAGDIAGVTAGTGLTGGGTSGTVALTLTDAMRTRGINYIAGCDSCSALTDTDDQPTFYQNVIGSMTVQEVRCFSDAGAPSIQIQKNDGTPANMLSANLACSTGGTTTSTFVAGESSLALNDRLNFLMVTAGGVAKRVTVVVKAIVN